MTSAGPLFARGLGPRRCRHCGASSPDPFDLRIGIVCCDAALVDQIAWRTEELERLRSDAHSKLAAVSAAEAEAQTAPAYKRDEALESAARARRAFDARLRDHYRPIADELKAEIERYEALRRSEEPPPTADLPRPYRDD